MINKIINMISNMIKQAFVSTITDDSSQYPQAGISYMGKSSYAVRLSPYGLCSNPPEGSLCVVLGSSGQESVKFAMIDDMPRRFKNLKEGEVALFNYMSGSYALLKENGDIEVLSNNNLEANVNGNSSIISGGTLYAEASAATVKATSITLDGNVSITGNLVVDGTTSGPASGPLGVTDIQTGGINFTTHVHGGVTPGASDTGVAK